jgi:phenylpyruvate tautomerase PptA (4-oxalocrotonate tautomerase family)
MPIMFVDAPFGIRQDAKQKLMRDLTTAVEEAYEFDDTRIWLREHAAENVALDGHIAAEPMKPVCSLEAPELDDLATKSTMAAKILTAMDEAYSTLANTAATLILINHYPLENTAWAGRLGSEHPDAVAYTEQLNG